MSVTSVKSIQHVRGAAMRRVIYIAFSTAALSLFGASVHADTFQDTPAQKTVRYADLDMSQQGAAQMLYARLQGAAKQVCGEPQEKDPRRLHNLQLYRECYEKSLSDAVASVDESGVTALYRSDRTIRVAQAAARIRTSS